MIKICKVMRYCGHVERAVFIGKKKELGEWIWFFCTNSVCRKCRDEIHPLEFFFMLAVASIVVILIQIFL